MTNKICVLFGPKWLLYYISLQGYNEQIVTVPYKGLRNNRVWMQSVLRVTKKETLRTTTLDDVKLPFWKQQAVLRKIFTLPHPPKTCNRLLYFLLKKRPKKVEKKAAKKAARKAVQKFIPEPVLLLPWNRSKTGLVNHYLIVRPKMNTSRQITLLWRVNEDIPEFAIEEADNVINGTEVTQSRGLATELFVSRV